MMTISKIDGRTGKPYEACGYEVAGRTGQNLKTVSNAYYIGTGKVEETAALVEATEADLVIFDNELTPAQQRNLEKLCTAGCWTGHN